MNHTTRSIRGAAAALAATLVAATLATVLPAAPAGAHEGSGVLTVEGVHPAGTSVHYVVRLTWENDGHAATGASVTATAVAADGTQLTPVPLPPVDQDGRYAGLVEFGEPGPWTVRFTSVDPTGTAEISQQITPPPTSTSVTGGADSASAGDAGTGTAAGEAEDGFAPADDGTGASRETAAGDGADSGMPVWLIGVALVVFVGGALAAVRVLRRYRTAAAGEAAQFEHLEAERDNGGASRSTDSEPGSKATT